MVHILKFKSVSGAAVLIQFPMSMRDRESLADDIQPDKKLWKGPRGQATKKGILSERRGWLKGI